MILKSFIYFLCTGNSCRSQMAEGYGRTPLHNVAAAASAGIEVHGLNPKAVKVMQGDGLLKNAHLLRCRFVRDPHEHQTGAAFALCHWHKFSALSAPVAHSRPPRIWDIFEQSHNMVCIKK